MKYVLNLDEATSAQRIKLLSRAVLKGWLVYPKNRTPVDCARDGLRLGMALETVNRLESQCKNAEDRQALGWNQEYLSARKTIGELGAKPCEKKPAKATA